ncbi:hypothetical protein KIW84_045802 [Lathyrus oleraceus]|uniref:Uncharacterized protein n=1 Tax=Pisum sativum TaxID=3888 RepID=A0A9D5AXP9_PEA|nr:hypothetical protein KIW84_045802 [Pisum sativum]
MLTGVVNYIPSECKLFVCSWYSITLHPNHLKAEAIRIDRSLGIAYCISCGYIVQIILPSLDQEMRKSKCKPRVLLVAQFLVNFCFALLKQLALRMRQLATLLGNTDVDLCWSIVPKRVLPSVLGLDSPGRVIYQWGSVYFRIPRADSDGYGYLLRDCLMMMMMMMMMCHSVPFISEPLRWIYGYMFPQMVVISSKIRGFCTFDDQGTWRMAMHCIHSSASFSLCIHLHSNSRIIARARRVIPLHSTRPHRYFTRRNTPRLMDLPSTDLLELKDKMTELINIMQGFAVGQKALADKVEKLERASAANSVVNLDGVSNQGRVGSRDDEKRATVGMVNNNAGGFGAATGGGPGLGHNLKDSLFPPFYGFDDDREEDRKADQFSMHNEPFGQYGAQPQSKEIQLLAEKVRALESHATPGFVNMSNMGLVEGIVIPQKFKAPSFDKYNGSSCPETHLQAFVRKISAYTTDQKLRMYFFQDSLSGGSLEWYTKLKSADIKSWQDLGDAFFKQYQFNADMAPSRT